MRLSPHCFVSRQAGDIASCNLSGDEELVSARHITPPIARRTRIYSIFKNFQNYQETATLFSL